VGYQQLKERQRAERGDWPENLGLRVHRALSWLDRAEQFEEQEDVDGQFIFLWIAFNAAYATDIDEKYRDSEQQTFRGFLDMLTQLDAGSRRFDGLVWTGEREIRGRLTQCQAARANAGTPTCRLVRSGAGVSCMQRTRRHGCRGRYVSEAGQRSDVAQRRGRKRGTGNRAD